MTNARRARAQGVLTIWVKLAVQCRDKTGTMDMASPHSGPWSSSAFRAQVWSVTLLPESTIGIYKISHDTSVRETSHKVNVNESTYVNE
jgi:hypothetical protein